MEKIYEFVKEELKNDLSGHNIQHIDRVVNNANYLILREGGNKKIIITACLLHDLVDDKLFTDIEEQTKKIMMLLSNEHYLPKEIEEILEIINSISFHKGNTNECINLNLEIVRDADRLDALGAIGIIRAIEYGNRCNRLFYDDTNLNKSYDTITFKDCSNTTLSHFYQKLLVLEKYMHTYTAKIIAKKRTEFLKSFLDEFYDELK